MTAPVIAPALRLAAYGNCVINNWYDSPTMEQLAGFDAFIGKVAQQHPDGVLLFVLVEPGTPILSAEQRKEMEAIYARWSGKTRAVAQVVEGGNLWSLTARSVMTALRLVQRRPYPTRVFSEVGEGAEWTSQYVSRPDNDNARDATQGLMAEVQRLRASSVAA
jgi:hypothetical protein